MTPKREREGDDSEENATAAVQDQEIEPVTADQLTTDKDPPPLSDKERAEKEKLLAEGFSDWSKRDFTAFVKACERHGRGDIPSIAADS